MICIHHHDHYRNQTSYDDADNSYHDDTRDDKDNEHEHNIQHLNNNHCNEKNHHDDKDSIFFKTEFIIEATLLSYRV